MRFFNINFAAILTCIFSTAILLGLSACQQTHTHDSNPPEGVQTPTSPGQSTYALTAPPPHAILVTELPNRPGQPAKTTTILGAIGPAAQPAQPAQPVTITTAPTIMQIQEQGNVTIITTRPAPPTSAPTTQPMSTTAPTAPK